ncbi:DUF3967 domain-containing protein [Bacillus sp. AFS041924]|uniref:DUF3967 domain-containing protein n=1 Tax=Bacillus sp. AFS041924 TaxID=2033503 RepID=UPI00159BA086|nr:DUF3967 domain-containing protein [Bacillus sp. AFS041924]
MSVIFTSKDISKKLKIGKSRVREISKELEKKEYHFTKNQDTRIYNQKDFELFQIIIKEYQQNDDLSQSIQFGLNTLLNQSLSTIHENETPSIKNEMTEHNANFDTNITPNLPLDNNIHKSFDMKNDIQLTDPKIDEIVEAEGSKLEKIEEIVLEHSFSHDPKQFEESVTLVETIDKVVIGHPFSQDTEQFRESVTEMNDEVAMAHPFSNSTDQAEKAVSQLEKTEELVMDHTLSQSINESNTPKVKIEDEVKALSFSQDTEQFEESVPVQKYESLEDEEVQEYRFEEMTVEQVLEENKKLPDEVALSKLSESSVVRDPLVSKESITTFVPTNSNQIMFEEFMSQITNLANQNEQILTQNQTLIKQNLEKDEKLEKILSSVEEKSEELQGLALVIEEKDEKLDQMFEEIKTKESGRDAQLMRMIRELQETKKMVAASKERDWKNAIKSLFFKPKSVK